MNTSGVSIPPEWLDTTSAPPAAGMFSMVRTSARCHRLISGPTVSATCLVNEGSHFAVSGSSRVSSVMVPRSSLIGSTARDDTDRDGELPADMLLSFFENPIFICGGREMTETGLVTGAFGLVGAQAGRRLGGAGHRVVATALGPPVQRKAAAALPARA